MKAKINQRLLQSLLPKVKPYEVRDELLRGFILRIQPTGSMTYYVEWARGKRSRVGHASTLLPQEARNRARQLLHASFHGEDPIVALKKRQSISFGEFLSEHYAPWAHQNLVRGESTVKRIEANFGSFRKYSLSAITTHQLEKWRSEKIARGLKPTTVNRDFNSLRGMLTKAVEWGYISKSPASDLKAIKVREERGVRYLSRDEFSRLITALKEREIKIRAKRTNANAWRKDRYIPELREFSDEEFADHLFPLVILSLNTGIRRGEAFSLEWEDVDFDQHILTVRGTTAKSGRRRTIPLNDDALKALKAWKKTANQKIPLVFPGPSGHALTSVKTAFSRICKEANITRFRWHDLRHTYASALAMGGKDLNLIRELLGHSDYKMTLVYAHLAPNHKATATKDIFRSGYYENL